MMEISVIAIIEYYLQHRLTQGLQMVVTQLLYVVTSLGTN